MKTKRFSAMLIPAGVALVNLLIVFFPRDVVAAARSGLDLWLTNVLPSLLPFMVGVNLMSALGMTAAIGRMIQPVTRKLFGLSGPSGFVIASGLLSGYPCGARVCAELRGKGELSKDESDRLIMFANNSGPLFVLATLGETMFRNPAVGVFILIVHYLSAITLGLLVCRIWPVRQSVGRKSGETSRSEPKKPFGTALSESVMRSMETMLLVGGFVIMFSVITRILELTNVYSAVTDMIRLVIPQAGRETISSVLSGSIEFTNGLSRLSLLGANGVTITIAAALVSFGGFSVHAQSAALLARTDINPRRYILGKFAQALISAALSLALLPFFRGYIFGGTVPAFSPANGGWDIVRALVVSAIAFTASVAVLLTLGILCSAGKGRKRRSAFR